MFHVKLLEMECDPYSETKVDSNAKEEQNGTSAEVENKLEHNQEENADEKITMRKSQTCDI